MRICGLFPFSTALHCYIGSLWLILLFFNSHSLLYWIIVAYFPLEQSLIFIWDNCGLFSFRTTIHCFMRSCGLFSFPTALHCYIGSLWLILLFNSHSLLYANVWLIPLFNSHSLLYANLWLIPLFNSPSLLYRIIVAYSPFFQQPFIVILDHCGLFSFRTVTHCYMRQLWLILL